jgi:hypothetical protein
MYGAQFDPRELGATIDRLAEHIEHPRANGLPNRDLERAAGICDARATREALRGSHCNSADAMRIQLCPNLDQDLRLVTGAQEVVYRRQLAFEAGVNDAAAHRQDNTVIL